MPAEAGSGPVVSFLFSDIESSTRRWENHPEAMAADLFRHDEILRDAVEGAGGEVYGHTGDGMTAAFAAPEAAVAAAVAAQDVLARTIWAVAAPLRVRMAIHSGPVIRRGASYFGHTLNRVTRLMAAAWGGQVLCSKATVDLMGPELPSGVALVDLGEHRLKDLSRPERVFQVAHPNIGSDFPPLRSLGQHRHNLPVALNSFVGRTLEQKELTDLLPQTRLLTLTGVGGAGKTRLALQVAAGVIERYADGVWLVELAFVREEGLVASALASALGMETSGLSTADAVAEQVVTYLAPKRVLLLFDNCEHLVDASARLIHDVLARCPGVTVLATSRELLGVPGEVPWRVPPLSLPPAEAGDPLDLLDSDAVTLLWERVGAVRPRFELTATNAVDVARICRRLDGIPLALELAAARVPMLGIQGVAERMDDCFNLLTGGARTALPRQQTLRATLDWSYGLLAPVEQAALRRLGVFPAGFLLDAAEAVMLGDPGSEPPTRGEADALSLVGSLVDKSLVVVVDEDAEPVRYRLLQPVRQYALERLTGAGEEPATSRRHRDFYLALAAGWGTNRFLNDRVGRVTADQESIEAALEWSWNEEDFEAALRLAAALWPLWLFGGRPGGKEWLERVVARTASIRHAARVEAIMALIFVGVSPDRHLALAEEAVMLARKLDDPYALGMMAFSEADRMLESGLPADARATLENAISIYEGVGYEIGIGTCHFALGWVAVGEDDDEWARRHFERAAELAQRRRDPWNTAHAIAALAPMCVRAGETERGLQLASEAVAAARGLPMRLVLVMTLTRAGETALLAGDEERAADALGEALQLLSILGSQRFLGDCLELVALILAARGESAAAAEMFGASSGVHEALGETSAIRLLAEQSQACRRRLAEQLGDERFARHDGEGHALPAEQAIAVALARLGGRSSRSPIPA